jgi:hypothetical protein
VFVIVVRRLRSLLRSLSRSRVALARIRVPVAGPRLRLAPLGLVTAVLVKVAVVAPVDHRLVARDPAQVAEPVAVPELAQSPALAVAVRPQQVAPAEVGPLSPPGEAALLPVVAVPVVPVAVLPVVVPAQRVAVSAPAVAVDAAPAREPRDDYRHELFRSHSPHRCR